MWRRNAVRDVASALQLEPGQEAGTDGADPRVASVPNEWREWRSPSGVRSRCPSSLSRGPGAGRCSRATGTQTATDSPNEAVAGKEEDINTTAERHPRGSYTFPPPSSRELTVCCPRPWCGVGAPRRRRSLKDFTGVPSSPLRLVGPVPSYKTPRTPIVPHPLAG